MKPALSVLVLFLFACSGGATQPADGGAQVSDGGLLADGGISCSCSLPHAATTACLDGGGCGVVRCEDGFRDLDGLAENGCESSCQPLTLSGSGALDFNVEAVRVSGRVTLSGTMAPEGTSRGLLRFLLAGTKTPVDFPLPNRGDAVYSTPLFKGTYRISFEKGDDCGTDKLPCGSQLLAEAQPLNADGALDFDLKPNPALLIISGQVTVNGAVMADASGSSRGTVVFKNAAGVVSATAALPPTGIATYSVKLAPGTYDVLVQGASGCTASSGPLPCFAVRRKQALTLSTNGALDLDVPVISVTGALKVNDAPVSAAMGSAAAIRIRDTDGAGPPDMTKLEAGYKALLTPGAYDVSLIPTQTCLTGGMPCQSRKVHSAVPLSTSGALDVVAHVVKVTGSVTLNGSPATAATRGNVIFTAPDGSASTALRAPASYSLLLYAGSYDVSLDNQTQCDEGPLPCAPLTVKRGVSLTADGALDLDAPVLTVSGAVTANGSALEDAPTGSSRGALTFTRADLPDRPIVFALDPQGAQQYSVSLYPGLYSVRFTNSGTCTRSPLPCQTWGAQQAFTVNTSTTLNIDLPVLQITGTVTADGEPLPPAASGNRGNVGLVSTADKSTTVTTIDPTGPALYRLRVFPGTYQQRVGRAAPCTDGGLPCQAAAVRENLELHQSGALDVDVKTVTVSGTVTVNGQALVDSNTERGQLRFGQWGSMTPAIAPLSAQGPATYKVRVVPGAYDVGLIAKPRDCLVGPMPCQSLLLRGCNIP